MNTRNRPRPSRHIQQHRQQRPQRHQPDQHRGTKITEAAPDQVIHQVMIPDRSADPSKRNNVQVRQPERNSACAVSKHHCHRMGNRLHGLPLSSSRRQRRSAIMCGLRQRRLHLGVPCNCLQQQVLDSALRKVKQRPGNRCADSTQEGEPGSGSCKHTPGVPMKCSKLQTTSMSQKSKSIVLPFCPQGVNRAAVTDANSDANFSGKVSALNPLDLRKLNFRHRATLLTSRSILPWPVRFPVPPRAYRQSPTRPAVVNCPQSSHPGSSARTRSHSPGAAPGQYSSLSGLGSPSVNPSAPGSNNVSDSHNAIRNLKSSRDTIHPAFRRLGPVSSFQLVLCASASGSTSACSPPTLQGNSWQKSSPPCTGTALSNKRNHPHAAVLFQRHHNTRRILIDNPIYARRFPFARSITSSRTLVHGFR